MLMLFVRMFYLIIKWTVAFSVFVVLASVKLVQMAFAATKRLHVRSQSAPHPRRYFWARFSVFPAVVVVALMAMIVSAAVATPAHLTSASSGSDPSSLSATEPATPTTSNSESDPSPSATDTPVGQPSASAGDATGGPVLEADATLPDSARTPGAINPAVTQADIGQTICVSGWTATVRPSSSVTTALKVEQLQSGYTYNGDMSTSDYEEDHLISLELGGSPASPLNLWPEPYTGAGGARVKDQVENKLHSLVCSGALPLATAQTDIATNWWAAYETYVAGAVVAPAPPAPAAPAPAAPAPAPAAPAPAPAPDPGHPAGATAQCNDGSYSFAAHHQGACSHHGGVAVFYN
jgi:hypothetical protein